MARGGVMGLLPTTDGAGFLGFPLGAIFCAVLCAVDGPKYAWLACCMALYSHMLYVPAKLELTICGRCIDP